MNRITSWPPRPWGGAAWPFSTFPSPSCPSPLQPHRTTHNFPNALGDSGPLAFAYVVRTAWNALHPDSPSKGSLILPSRFSSPVTPAVAFPDHRPTPQNTSPSLSCHHLLLEETMYSYHLQQSLSHSRCFLKLRPCIFKSYLFFKAQLNFHEALFGSFPLPFSSGAS